jgi:PIN domain nuclease of toxin-antitoxin system
MILDTCALLWLAEGGQRLTAAAKRRISLAPVVYVCAISGFEIGVKTRLGKLILPATAQEWFGTTLAHHSLEELPLTLELCLAAAELPAIHRDPCDRFIIAAARRHDLPVVTADPVFREYGVRIFC